MVKLYSICRESELDNLLAQLHVKLAKLRVASYARMLAHQGGQYKFLASQVYQRYTRAPIKTKASTNIGCWKLHLQTLWNPIDIFTKLAVPSKLVRSREFGDFLVGELVECHVITTMWLAPQEPMVNVQEHPC
jgi:hypothetical protein